MQLTKPGNYRTARGPRQKWEGVKPGQIAHATRQVTHPWVASVLGQTITQGWVTYCTGSQPP